MVKIEKFLVWIIKSSKFINTKLSCLIYNSWSITKLKSLLSPQRIGTGDSNSNSKSSEIVNTKGCGLSSKIIQILEF